MFLVNTKATFGVDFGTGASLGAVTVDITRSDGTELVTDGATTDNTDGTYSFELSAVLNDQLDRLRLSWTVTSSSETVSTFEEIVGSLLFTIAQARAVTITGQQTPLASSSTYPDADIARARRIVTELFEQRTGAPQIRRYARVELHGNGSPVIDLWDGRAVDTAGSPSGGPGRFSQVARVVSATVGGTAQTVSNLAVDGRSIIHKTGVWAAATRADPFNVVIDYEYGPLNVNPEANEYGLLMAVKNLVPNDLSAYIQSATNEDGSFRYGPNGFVYPSQVWDWLRRNKPVLIA